MALFNKALNRVDIEQGVVLDPGCVAVLPPLRCGQMNLSVTDGQNVWEFIYSHTYSGRSPKPRFTGGWLEFARVANLRPGNKIYFYENADKATRARYRIEVRR